MFITVSINLCSTFAVMQCIMRVHLRQTRLDICWMQTIIVKAVKALVNLIILILIYCRAVLCLNWFCMLCLQVGKFHKENSDSPSLASPP